MPAPTVVDDFIPVGNGLACGITGRAALTVVEFGFKRRLERLGHRVIGAHISNALRIEQCPGCGKLPRASRW